MTHIDTVISIYRFIFLPVSIMGIAGVGRSRNNGKGVFNGWKYYGDDYSRSNGA